MVICATLPYSWSQIVGRNFNPLCYCKTLFLYQKRLEISALDTLFDHKKRIKKVDFL